MFEKLKPMNVSSFLLWKITLNFDWPILMSVNTVYQMVDPWINQSAWWRVKRNNRTITIY